MNTEIRECVCCEHLRLFTDDNDVCENCGIEYHSDETDTYVNVLEMMDAMERI